LLASTGECTGERIGAARMALLATNAAAGKAPKRESNKSSGQRLGSIEQKTLVVGEVATSVMTDDEDTAVAPAMIKACPTRE